MLGLGLGLSFGSSPLANVLPKTGLLALWDPKSAVLSGIIITSLPDSSGGGDTNKTMTPFGSPTITASDANYGNNPTVNLVGSSTQGFQTGVWASSLAQPFSIVIVGHVTTADLDILLAGRDGTNNVFAILSNSTQSNGSVALQCPSTTLTAHNTERFSSPGALLLEGSGASSSIYSGNFTTPIASGDADTGGAAGLTLGSDNDKSSFPVTGTIALAAVWDHVLSSTERAALRAYINARFALAIT